MSEEKQPVIREYRYTVRKTLIDGTVKEREQVIKRVLKVNKAKPGRKTAVNKVMLRNILKYFNDDECELLINYSKDNKLGKFKEVCDEESD
jgi:hypothetical protein